MSFDKLFIFSETNLYIAAGSFNNSLYLFGLNVVWYNHSTPLSKIVLASHNQILLQVLVDIESANCWTACFLSQFKNS